MEDRNIIDLLWRRAEEALSALAQRFGPRLTGIAMNILGNPQDAEECVSDTYLAVWNAIPPNKPDPLAGYVYRIGRNQALKRLRHQTAQRRFSGYTLSLDELAGCIPDAALEEQPDARALGQSIDRFLDTLSPDNRRLFLRRYWFGDSLQTVARELGLRENTAAVRLSRIRQKLHEHLQKEGFVYAE